MHAVPFTLLLAASSSVAQLVPTPIATAATVATAAPVPLAPPARTPAAALSPAASGMPQPASPSPVAAPTAAPTPPPLPRDRAANLIGGVWQCDTIGGSTGTHTYTENEVDGSIELTTELHAGYRTFHIRESYQYDDSRKLWTARTDGDVYVGTAQAWTGYKWTFEGTERERGVRRPVRMVYFDLADQAFRRDFQAKQEGTWQTYSAETCRRPSN